MKKKRLTAKEWRITLSRYLKKKKCGLMAGYKFMVNTYGMPVMEEGTPAGFELDGID
ncbi:MAG: hypothetical protein KIH89_001050 [Candidatus Shapirobacteria bacterium]|nr:hypothetical protein [Candidatus Shapirobacteria bacterium]